MDFFIFFVVVSWENCFVQTSLQRVCGGRVSSNIFLIQVSIEICLARISLQRFFKRNVFEGILVRIRSSDFFGRDSFSQSFGWECLFRDSFVRIFSDIFG